MEGDGGGGGVVEDVPAFESEGVGSVVELAEGVAHFAVAAVVDVGFEEVVEGNGAVRVVVDSGSNVVTQSAAGGIDAY